jgi:hypothetical protein
LLGTSAQRLAGETYVQAVARLNQTYGGLDVIRVFHTGLPVGWSKLNTDFQGAPLIVSFKMSPAQVISGQYDAYMRSWFASAPTGRPTWWTYWHEPEDDIERGAFTATAYRQAWAHLADLAAQAGNPQLRSTLILMCWSLASASHRTWRDYYAAGSIQALGFDCYNNAAQTGVYRSAESIMGNVWEVARQTGLPWGLAEFGSHVMPDDDGTGRARWLSDMVAGATAHNAQFMTYYDSNAHGDFRLLDQPSQSMWRALVSS